MAYMQNPQPNNTLSAKKLIYHNLPFPKRTWT